MRKILVCLLTTLLLISGCSKKAFEPIVTVTTHILELNEEVDPLQLIVDEQNAGLTFEVVENKLDVTVPGDYDITYKVSLNRNSVEKTFTFTVKDTDPPVIECEDRIEILYGNPFIFTDHVRATDPQDGDVINTTHYDGSINTYKEGEYLIKIIAEDRFGNTSEKDVTVVIKKDSSDSYRDKICGTYRDSSYTDGQAPTLTLNNDGTFSMYISNCSLLTRIEGTYLQYEDTLFLTSEDYIFSYVPEENLVRFIVQIDGTLMFDSHLNLCAPNYGDLFEK